MKPLLLVLLQAWLFLPSESRKNGENVKHLVCSSSVCTERAKLITQSLNDSASPCDDFYSYVCGGWESLQRARNPDTPSFSIYDILSDEVKKTIKGILESPSTPSNTKQDITDKVGIIYNSCMESSVAFPNISDEPDGMKKVLASSGLSEWPILANTTVKVPEENNATAMLLKIGIKAVFEIVVRKDPENSTSHILQIRKPGGRASDLSFSGDALKEAAKFLRPNASEPQLEEFSDSVVKYGLKLRGLGIIRKEIPRFTIAQLQRNFSHIPLLPLLNKEFEKLNITLKITDVVELQPLEFYSNLNSFIECANPITMFNYAGAQVMFAVGAQASKNFSILLPRSRKYCQKHSHEERWAECLELMRAKMRVAVENLYAERTRNSSVKTEVEDIFERVKNALRERLFNSSWIDKRITDTLVEKLNKMEVIIGHAEALLNPRLLEQTYEDLPLITNESTFVELFHTISTSNYRRQLKKLRQEYNAEEAALASASAVSAFYIQETNKLVVPWGLLQPPVYQLGLPSSLNYGGIGVIIAEEMVRALNIKGTFMSSNGVPEDMLSNSTRLILKNKTDCFVSQYNNFRVDLGEYGIRPINGKKTLYENIADNAGLLSAFRAYLQLLEQDCENTDTGLKDLGFSGKQLFFLTNGMESCELWNKYCLWENSTYSSKSPPMGRVNVPLTNLAGFYGAFNCTGNSRMYAKENERCELW